MLHKTSQIIQILLFGIMVSFVSTVSAEETVLTKYYVVQDLFRYFHISINSLYTVSPIPLKQYYRDIWPANPYYGVINTACEMKLITCDKEMFFDGELPISTTSALKIFYTLKWQHTPELLYQKIEGYTGSIWYFPYIHEAFRTNILDSSVSLQTLSWHDWQELLRRDTILTAYQGIIPSYFRGLEADVSHITPERYYNLSEVHTIMEKIGKLLYESKQAISFMKNGTERVQMEQKLILLKQNYEAFVSLAQILEQNPFQYDPTIPDDIKSLIMQYGIREKIGESFYDFSKSPAYRKFNIKTALKKVQGVILQDGEEFNFNKVIYDKGLRDFRMGWVIRKGKEEMAIGGGICGAATTIFEAAYRSGLQITERKSHSQYLFSFYSKDKIGLDAMVYNPRPNLRFVNNTGMPILLYLTYSKDNEANLQVLGNKHFDTLTLDGPNWIGKKTKWIRQIWYKNGSFSSDELLSSFSKIY